MGKNKFNYDLTDIHKHVESEFIEVKKKFPEFVSMYYDNNTGNIMCITEHELTEERKKQILIHFELEGAECINFEVKTECSYGKA
jgi:hypothetical protein